MKVYAWFFLFMLAVLFGTAIASVVSIFTGNWPHAAGFGVIALIAFWIFKNA